MIKTNDNFPGVEWVDGTGDFIRVDKDKCTGCGNCMNVCLGDCWEIIHQKAHIKTLATCMECASCWYVCDADAVDFSWPKGGTGYKSDWG